MTARKLAPLTKKAIEMSKTAIMRPATAGPITRAALKVAELRAMALTTSSRPTISTANDWRTGISMAFAQPRRIARTRIIQTSTTPVRVRTPSATARAAITASTAMSVGRLGRASAMRPPKRPRTRTGVHCAAATTPRMSGSLVRVRTSQAWATDCIQEPASEIAWPPKKRRKLRWRRARRAFTFVTAPAGHGPALRVRGAGDVGGRAALQLGQVGAQVRPARLGRLEHRPEAVRSSPRESPPGDPSGR